MKRFVIKYTHHPESGPLEEWHKRVREFISALDGDAELMGRITYRCMKVKDSGDHYHLVEAEDDVPNLLAQREWFKAYTAETKRVAGGEIEVMSMETIAETKLQP
jgi:hypothetical protein